MNLPDHLLAATAFAMVATFMVLILSGRVPTMVALTLVPVSFGLLAGFGSGLGAMMHDGLKALAPTGVMLIFAILYFGLMIDAGLFDPLTAWLVQRVHGDPLRILVGTAALAMLVSIDGDGATTYMITTAAMLPLYRQLGMDTRKMACVIILAGAVMNILPWGGPTARVLAALDLDAGQVFVPLIPAMAMTAIWVLYAAWRLGLGERRRLASGEIAAVGLCDSTVAGMQPRRVAEARPSPLWWLNLGLTGALLLALALEVLPLAVLFMLAVAIALPLNHPTLTEQRVRLASHAGNALAVGGTIFAAGIFTGILTGTGMAEAMSRTVTAAIPPAIGPGLALITALLSAPFTWLISNDAFYFGVLPVLAETAQHFGVDRAEIGRAALVGQQIHLLSPLVPSTYLLAGLAGIEFGELLRATIGWALGSFTVFLLACLAFGVFPLG